MNNQKQFQTRHHTPVSYTHLHDEAKLRAQNAAGKLANLADQPGTIALFAHGWFNRMMRPYLKLLGYTCVEAGGDWPCTYRIYQKHD